jgi:hypothetical protein
VDRETLAGRQLVLHSHDGGKLPKDVLVVLQEYAIMGIMRFCTLALALALGIGATGMAQASPAKQKTYHAPKYKKGKKFKQSKASKVKPRKAKKVKRARRA